ncbi:MAG: tyrosine-type recombinase/integrase [bacterium]
MAKRKPAKQIAKIFAKHLRKERADYLYLKDIFRNLRAELNVIVTTKPKKLPYVPTEEEMQRYYKNVWQTRNMQHMVLIKTLLYTGLRVSEITNIKLEDVDLEACQIHAQNSKGGKDRKVPFPHGFKEVLALHMNAANKKGAGYLFESSWKRPYTTRGIRKMLDHYTKAAGMSRSISPHKLRHFLFTWLKKQGIDDALIQPYSGHESRQSLEIYSRLSIGEAQKEYNRVIDRFPV